MTFDRNKKRLIVLGILLALTCAALAFCFISWSVLRLRVSFAEDQTAIFEQMRFRAETADVVESVKCLQYVIAYYPSGSKQATGTKLDQIVERARENCIQQMIQMLREKTGKDLGDDPQRWIESLREFEHEN